ncbi:hypothetical protein [Pseudomonas sp. MM227]|uniref:hypothetical protein n=1 Tax=Pseudomonas sp. MM227 TaxID=3019968 RepID=UPI002220522B|nr:hypothetical protein [Pseudomonas sp. MM227]
MILVLIIGMLAFCSGYLVSLEDRLQRDRTFHPFDVLNNFRASPRCRKKMAYVGMLIFVLAGVVYLLEPEVIYSSRDKIKALGAVMLLWSFMFYGYCRELEFNKSGSSPASLQCMDCVEGTEWYSLALKGFLATSKVLAVFAFMYAIKRV